MAETLVPIILYTLNGLGALWGIYLVCFVLNKPWGSGE